MTLAHGREDEWLDAPLTARAGAPAMPPPHALQVLRRHALVMCAVMAPSAVPAKHPLDYQGIAARGLCCIYIYCMSPKTSS
jgi:hypothetical protein